MELTVKELQARCYAQAKEKGWTEKPVSVPEQVALLCSEACEALESFRKHDPVSFTVDGKPEGIASEYADIVIRVCHYAEVLGFDLEAEILRKLDYNMTRPYRHGGKAV